MVKINPNLGSLEKKLFFFLFFSQSLYSVIFFYYNIISIFTCWRL
jgi:hypothetical protein